MTLLEEYAYNTDPGSHSSAANPSAITGIDPADQARYIDFTYIRWKSASPVSDVEYEIQASTDLSTWGSTGLEIGFPSAAVANGDGTETVTVRVKFGSAVERRFVRLELTSG